MKAFHIKLLVLFGIILLSFTSCQVDKTIQIPFNSGDIHYMGRINKTDSASTFYWSGTSASINFEGTSVSALIQDETGDNYYNAIIDKDSVILIRPGTKKLPILLAGNLPDGKHSVQLFKRTEMNRGETYFYGFNIQGKILPADPIRKRKIEFYGNSITAGFGIEDYSGNDSPDSIFTNNYLTYAARTARYFDAEYHCICKSGIGIMISWFPTIMPDIYDLLNPNDEESKWDFSQYSPQLVVINLFQNDSWLVDRPEHASFKKYFVDKKPTDKYIINSYKEFVAKIRSKYPNAHIICTLGSMDATNEGSIWPSYVSEAVYQMDDSKIFTYFMPYKNSTGHPKVEENEVMAKGLINFIEKNINW